MVKCKPRKQETWVESPELQKVGAGERGLLELTIVEDYIYYYYYSGIGIEKKF